MARATSAKPAARAPARSGVEHTGPIRAYLLWGQDDFRKRQALAALLDDLVPVEDRELDVQYIDASNAGVTGEQILNAARDRAMFTEKRVVVVLNAGRLRGPRHQRTHEVLAEGLLQLPEYSTLVLVSWAEEPGERRGRSPFPEKLMAAIRKAGKVLQFSLLQPEELAALAAAEAAALGKKLATDAARMLAERGGPDADRVLQETRKLAAFAGERGAITCQDVEEMVPARPDDNVFHLLDAAMGGDTRRALDLFRQLRQSDVAVQQVLSLLGRTLRQVAQAKYLLDHRVPPTVDVEQVDPDLLAALPEEGCLYPDAKVWLRKRLWEQARRISWEHLHQALDRLAVTDAGTKGWEQGIEDPDLAMEVYIASLCEAVRARR